MCHSLPNIFKSHKAFSVLITLVNRCYPILSIFFFFYIGASQHHESIVITITADQDDRELYGAKLKKLLPESFMIKEIGFDADVYLQRDEFDYLVGMRERDTVTSQTLTQSVYYLMKKQKFDAITITVDCYADGARIHFQLSSFWTFKKVKFKGIFVGKEYYRQYYIMECGDRFDLQKHEDSIKKITESFKQDGYFAAHVKADLIYDNKTKSVTVCLYISKGPRFAIGSVQMAIESDLLCDGERDALYESIQVVFIQPFLRNWYNRDLINNQTILLRDFLAKRSYLHVDVDLQEHVHYMSKRIDLDFIIHLSYKKGFEFVGNHFYSNSELLDFMLAFGRSTSLLPASILSEEIIKKYHDKGFWAVSVDAQECEDGCRFIINEGARSRIVDIELRNLFYFNKQQLIKKFFMPILRKKYYDAHLIDKAIDKALAYFLTFGFWQCALLHKKIELIDKTDNAYTLIITFEEGIQSFLNSVNIEGFNDLLSQGPFREFHEQQKKIPFDVAFIEEQRQWLQQYFQKEGYYQPQVRPLFDKHEGDIDVTWQVDVNGPQVQFGKTVLLGATKFPFKSIQRELDYKIGDPWHNNALRHSISRLQKLEIFESVHLFPDKKIDSGHEHVMLLKLQEDDPFELKMRIGAGLQHVTKSLTTGGPTYRLGGSFIWKNPANCGDQFRFDADFTRAIRLVNAQYRLPWIFNVPVNAMLQGYTNRFEYPGFIGSQKNLYTVIQQGFLVNLTGVYNVIDAALSTGVEVVDTYIDESKEDGCFAKEVARAINFRPELLDKNIPFFLIQPTCILFYLDNTVNPTRGSFSVLSIKGMFPMAKLAPSNFFIRILAEQSFFIPCLPLVFALRIRFGHIFHPKFSTIIPIERFYLGGANSIRSYETDQCPPLGTVCDNGKELFVPQGGRSLANLNLEMRFPLYNQFGGVVFTDVGVLSNNRLAEIRAQDCLSGIGFGLRYNTAIGPLRFDVAWRGRKHDGVGRPYAWFLSFGNAFI